jgi:hypothetical protein
MIQAKFGLNWPSGFRGEDFLKSLQTDDGRQTPSDGNSSHRWAKNGIKWIYIYVTMIGQVLLSCLNRNSHIFILIDRLISEKTPEIFG